MKQIKVCHKCGGRLEMGMALQNTVECGIPDFPGQPLDSRGQTMSQTGPAKEVSVWKCERCGYSITPGGE